MRCPERTERICTFSLRGGEQKRWGSNAASALADQHGYILSEIPIVTKPDSNKVLKADVQAYIKSKSAGKGASKRVDNTTNQAHPSPSEKNLAAVEDETNPAAQSRTCSESNGPNKEPGQPYMLKDASDHEPTIRNDDRNSTGTAYEAGNTTNEMRQVTNVDTIQRKANSVPDVSTNHAPKEFTGIDGRAYPLAGIGEMEMSSRSGIYYYTPCPIEGNVYKGTVLGVTHRGIFVDIGFSKDAFVRFGQDFSSAGQFTYQMMRSAIGMGGRVMVLINSVTPVSYCASLDNFNPSLDESLRQLASHSAIHSAYQEGSYGNNAYGVQGNLMHQRDENEPRGRGRQRNFHHQRSQPVNNSPFRRRIPRSVENGKRGHIPGQNFKPRPAHQFENDYSGGANDNKRQRDDNYYPNIPQIRQYASHGGQQSAGSGYESITVGSAAPAPQIGSAAPAPQIGSAVPPPQKYNYGYYNPGADHYSSGQQMKQTYNNFDPDQFDPNVNTAFNSPFNSPYSSGYSYR